MMIGISFSQRRSDEHEKKKKMTVAARRGEATGVRDRLYLTWTGINQSCIAVRPSKRCPSLMDFSPDSNGGYIYSFILNVDELFVVMDIRIFLFTYLFETSLLFINVFLVVRKVNVKHKIGAFP